jgi:hypothetical protein
MRSRKQCRIVAFHRCRCDGVFESDVDLYGNARAVEANGEGDAHALIVGVFGDSFGSNRTRIENESVGLDVHCAEFLKYLHDAVGRIGAAAEQVRIAGRTVWIVGPEFEEQGTFQDERTTVLGLAESVQNSFQAVFDEDQIEGILARASQIAKFLANRCRKILGQFYVRNDKGGMVPLASITRFEPSDGPELGSHLTHRCLAQ